MLFFHYCLDVCQTAKFDTDQLSTVTEKGSSQK